MPERSQGTVKWFDSKKGYGFIHLDDGNDVFAHYSEIVSDGFRSLKEGQKVEFEITDGKKGPVAVKIEVLS